MKEEMKMETTQASRNPFVNQVSFFVKPEDTKQAYYRESQSLRKSGQFLCATQKAKNNK